MTAIEDLTDVPAFVAAAEANGFAAAARRLNLSRSAVGKAVARLEARLGVRLFHRTTRSQSLTEEGQAFYEACRQALDALRQGRLQIDAGRRHVAGRLRVTMPALFGRICVAPILTTLAAQHPDLELDLQFGDRVVDVIEDRFDLAIRIGTLDDAAGLKVRLLGRQPMAVCAAPSYLAAHGRPEAPDDLQAHQAVVYGTPKRAWRGWVFPRPGNAAPLDIEPPSRLRFDDLGAIADAAVAGLGVAWLPWWLIRDHVRDGSLVHLMADRPMLAADCYALWPDTPRLPLRVRAAIDALVRDLPLRAGGAAA